MSLNWLILLFALILSAPAFGQIRNPVPEICGNGIDDNDDGTVDEAACTPDTAPIVADGAGNYFFHFKDCLKVRYANQADESFPDDIRVARTSGSHYNGAIACSGTLDAGTYNLSLRASSPSGARGIWISTTPLAVVLNNAEAFILPSSLTPQWWQPVRKTGSNTNFIAQENGGDAFSFVHGGGAFTLYFRDENNIRLACGYLSTSATPSPRCPGEGTAPEAFDYEIFELGAAAVPTDWNSAAFANANVMQFSGFDQGGPVCTVKIIWDNAATDRGFLSADCADTDDKVLALANDDANWFSAQHDNIDFRWRTDLIEAFDENMRMVSGNLQPVYFDADWGGASNARDPTHNLNTTVVRTIVEGTSWKIFMAFNVGAIAPGARSKCNFAIRDRDTDGSSKIKHTFGTTVDGLLNLNEFGVCKWSATAVPGSADTTAPVVTSPAIPSGLIEQTSFVATAATDEAGTCRVHYGTTTGVYTAQSSGSPSLSGQCSEAVTGLTSGTQYFAVVKVTDAAGNTGTSSEVNATTASACTHFAGPTAQGSANGSSDANRFLINGFWAVAGPGKILCLANGTYTGSSSMIVPTSNLSGNSLAPITIKATNDGQVTIDGQSVRRPIGLFQNNDWWIIEGINAKSSNHHVVGIAGNSDFNIIRRVIAWDAPGGSSDNFMVFSISSSTGNLFEDVFGFGKGRKIFAINDRGHNATIRRAFGIWMESLRSGPKMVYTNTYDTHGGLVENSIGMWDQTHSPSEPYGIFAQDGMNPALSGVDSRCSNSKYLGGIGIFRSGHTVSSSTLGSAFGSRSVDCTLFKDLMLYNDPGSHTTLKAILGQLFDGGSAGVATCSPNCDRRIEDITEVGWTVADSINVTSNGWTVSNKNAYASISAMNTASANPFQTSSGTGARVCFRYKDGNLTSEKLWPWPMDSRINAALTASGRNPDTYFGTGNTLTQYIESVFGTIPAGCKS